MHGNEAIWLACELSRITPAMLSPLLDIGSSTRHYREVEQPWVEEFLFAPLGERGVRVVHCDIKTGAGSILRSTSSTMPIWNG